MRGLDPNYLCFMYVEYVPDRFRLELKPVSYYCRLILWICIKIMLGEFYCYYDSLWLSILVLSLYSLR